MASDFDKDFGEAVDNQIADLGQALLARLQVERKRLVAKSSSEENGDFVFRKNSSFSELFDRLLNTQLGHFEEEEQKHLKSENQKEKCRSSHRSRKRVSRSIYDSMEVVATVKGQGAPIKKPTGIVAIPDKNCFVVQNLDRLSVLSAEAGTIKATHKIQCERLTVLPNTQKSCLAIDPFTNQLIMIYRGKFHTVLPVDLPSKSGFVEAIAVDAINQVNDWVPFGLGISQATGQLFTSNGQNLIAAYSLRENWSLIGNYRFTQPDVGEHTGVLGVRNFDSRLFFRGHIGKSLFTAKIDETSGNLQADELKMVDRKFGCLTGTVFDQKGNIIASDGDFNGIQVLTPDGSETLGSVIIPREKREAKRFFPTAVAMLTVPENGELFEFAGGEIHCSHVIAAPDCLGKRVIFFGSPEDC